MDASHGAAGGRPLLVLQGASRSVRPLTYADALLDARYRRWAASALAARIAGLDEASDAVGAKVVRGVLLEAWILPSDLPAGAVRPEAAEAPPGQPALRGWLLDRGTRIEIPGRGLDGRRQSPAFAPALVALATRLAVLKGWTHVAPLAGPRLDPARATTAEAMARDAAQHLARHGIEPQGASAGQAGTGPAASAAARWRRPHWLRAEVDDDERRARLGELGRAEMASVQAPDRAHAGWLTSVREAPVPVDDAPDRDEAPRLLL
jgi:hypothetical protein